MERTGHRPVAPPYATHRSGVDFWLVSEADSVARHARFPTALATLSWPFCYVQIAQDDNQPPYENDHSLVGGCCKEENEKKKNRDRPLYLSRVARAGHRTSNAGGPIGRSTVQVSR